MLMRTEFWVEKDGLRDYQIYSQNLEFFELLSKERHEFCIQDTVVCRVNDKIDTL